MRNIIRQKSTCVRLLDVAVDESNVMDTTTEFEPDVQFDFDDHNATYRI